MLRRIDNPKVWVNGASGKSRTVWNDLVHGPHKLTPVEFNSVMAGINQYVLGSYAAGNKIVVPGWLAGTFWQGKPWLIIYTKAAAMDEDKAAWMYGLMCQHAFIHDSAHWWCGYTTYNGHTRPNTYYFQ